MNRELFNDILERQLGLCTDKLVQKRQEYADDEDVLHNFKLAAELQKETPREALAGMLVKHTVSIYDMVRSPQSFPLSVWDEKITDHINYLIILSAIVQEELDQQALFAESETVRPSPMVYHTAVTEKVMKYFDEAAKVKRPFPSKD